MRNPSDPRIAPTEPAFDAAAVEVGIAGTVFAGTLVHLATVDSTQRLALAAAAAGAPQGVWIAGEQTAGRGRGAHTWHSAAADGLYMTALARPAIPMPSTLSLSLRTAIAVQQAIAETTGLRAPQQIDIRWPNDLVIPQSNGPSRKAGGILIELAAQPAPASGPAVLKHAVLGIGINLNHLRFPPELEPIATSLRRELPGAPRIAREPLAAAILRNLDAHLHELATSSQLPTDNSHLSAHSTWLSGKRVRVEAREHQPGYTGLTAGLTPEGFLRVQRDDGQIHIVRSGGLRELEG